MGDVKELSQSTEGLYESFLVGTVKLDGKLIDSFEGVVGREPQGIPLGAFHVHLDDDVTVGVTVLRQLILDSVEQPAVFGLRRGTNALRVELRVPGGAFRLLGVETVGTGAVAP